MHWLSKYRTHFLDDWFAINGKAFFGVVCLLYFSTFVMKRMFILDSIAAFEIMQERGEMWVMDLFFGLQYLAVPVFLAWKFCWTAFILWVGCFMFGYRVTYAQLWKMVMLMEVVFVVPEILKIGWFTLISTDPGYHDVVAFYPFSFMHFFDHESLPGRWHYPLKALNLFEILYCLLLIAGVHWLSHKKLKTATYIVLSSYVLFFLLWLGYYLLVYK